MKATIITFALAALASGCLSTVDVPATADGGAQPAAQPGDPTLNENNKDAIAYRDIASHPGCAIDGLETRGAGNENSTSGNNMKPYKAAEIPGYRCAAKEYAVTNEDKSKPIVLLVHGNSSTPSDWEKHPADSATPMLSERLAAAGFRTYAVDFRFDKVDDPVGPDRKTGNPAKNMDHGWTVPIATHFIESVLAQFPDRKISIVAFSLGPTTVRDALRRIHRKGTVPFARIKHLVLASGAHHGVKTFRDFCGVNPTMAGKVTCEMGDREAFVATAFSRGLNGEGGIWETPCADGSTAWGQSGVCGGNKVAYTTITMKDIAQGTYQDEFVSQTSASLKGAENKTVDLNDTDATGYFYNGSFKSHYGAVRSENGVKTIFEALSR
jgi:pimeloyl-ACP methyl ester carboxylesterase